MKNVLITGATGGIGRSIVEKFYRNDYNICASGTNTKKLEDLKKLYPKRLKTIKCDLTDRAQIEQLYNQSQNFYGNTEILINNAGITKDNLFLRMKDNEWDEVINVNLHANYMLSKLIIKDMVKSKWGRIINISSDAAKIGNPGQANYVASKSAIEGFTKSLALELASRNITVNALAPGFIETDMTSVLDDDQKERIIKMTMQDPMADMLTRIRNAQQAGIEAISMPSSGLKIAVAKVLEEEGYIESHSTSDSEGGKANLSITLRYHEGRPVIEEIRRLSRPGLRQYKSKDDIPQVKGGLGVIILSTNKGVMTDRAARAVGVGGELICSVF